MSNIVSNINERMCYENAQLALIRANSDVMGFNVNAYKLTQGYLRLEATAVVGQTRYAFNPLINQAPLLPTERRLNLQDSFIINQVGFYLGAAASATDSEFIPQSYPDPLIFPLGAAEYRKLYSGALSVSVNNNVMIPAWDILRHYHVPQQQTEIAAGAPPPSARLNEIDFATDGLYPMEPNIVLVGAKNNEIVLNMPEGFTAIDANTRLIMLFRGVLAQNSTVVA